MKIFINATELGRRAPGCVVLLMVLMMNSVAAKADQDDFFSPYVGADYRYDSNFFRVESDQVALNQLGTTNRAESYINVLAGATINFHLSRQLFQARAEVNQTRFNRFTALNFDGHNTQLVWDWVVGNALSGDAGMSDIMSQGSFVNIQQPINNLISTRQKFVHGVIQLGAPWKIKLGVEDEVRTNSLTSQQTQNSKINSYKAGLQYESRKGSLVEFFSQMSDGRYPNRQIVGLAPVDNGYTQWDNGISVTTKPTGQTVLKGNLNYTKRNYSDVPQRDFSGITGQLATTWQVTGKTLLGLNIYRNIGVVENTTASYSVNRGVEFTESYQATSKINLNLTLAQNRIAYTGDPGFVLSSLPAREDKLSSVQAGVNYKVFRNTLLGMTLQRGVNQSNQASASYTYNSVMLNVRSVF